MYWAKSLYTLTLRIWAFFFLRVMNETKKNAMNHIGHVLGKVAIHTDFENLGVFGPGDYTYIYTCVCVCVCVCIHIENLGVSVPEDYTHVYMPKP
jgi:hypothetical protein